MMLVIGTILAMQLIEFMIARRMIATSEPSATGSEKCAVGDTEAPCISATVVVRTTVRYEERYSSRAAKATSTAALTTAAPPAVPASKHRS
jgi:hypothetical protein